MNHGERNFQNENLRGKSFKGKKPLRPDFTKADIRGANFENAILTGAKFCGAKAGLQKRWVVILGLSSWLISTVISFFISFFSVIIFPLLALKDITKDSNLSHYNITTLIVVIILFFLFIYIIREGIGESVIVSIILAVVADGVVAIPFAAIRTINNSSELKLAVVILTLILAVVLIVVAFALVNASVLDKRMAEVFTIAIVLALAQAGFGAIGFALTGYEDKILEGVIAGAGAVGIALVLAFALIVAGALTFGIVFTITGDRAGVGAGAVALAIVCSLTGATVVPLNVYQVKIIDVGLVLFYTLLGTYLAWRSLRGDSREKWIRQAVIAFAAIGGTSFRGADLTDADFTEARLKSTDLRETTLTRVRWHHVEMLDHVRPGDTYLKDAQLRQWLRGIETVDNNFDGRDLRGVNLQGADLSDASFIRTDLSEADLSNTTLTGACLQDWNINSQTKLDDVTCNYVYLKKGKQERRPSEPKKEFQPGEFAKLVQKSLNTIDLIFSKGVDWGAVAYSIKKTQVLNGDTSLAIQSIENKGDGVVLIKVNVPQDADKGKIEGDFRQGYEFANKILKEQYELRLLDKDRSINQLFDLLNKAHEKLGEVPKVQQVFNAPVNAVGGNVEGNQNIYASEQKQTFTEVATEIVNLLDYFEQNDPSINQAKQRVKSITENQPEILDAEIVKEAINSSPTLKQRVEAAGVAAYIETVKMLLPPLCIAIETFKGDQNP